MTTRHDLKIHWRMDPCHAGRSTSALLTNNLAKVTCKRCLELPPSERVVRTELDDLLLA